MRIFDSVHGLMDFSEFERARYIVDTPLFQRLRHIKQLGVTEMLFPSATHSRFSHCLGAANLSLNIMNYLDIDKQLREVIFYGALLHDIGHGPFSHVFEHVFSKVLPFTIRHELWTPMFIEEGISKYGWFSDKPENQKKEFIQKLCSLISPKLFGNTLSFASDIISSQIDVDRMDYLLRDSHHCGVTYGLFDVEWLIDSLRIFEVEGGQRLGIHIKGIGALEQYLMARRMITEYIYSLPKSRSYERLIIFFISKLWEKIFQRDTPELKSIISPTLYKFLDFNPKDYQTQMEFVKNKFDYYKNLTDNDIWFSIQGIIHNKMNHIEDLYELSIAIYYRSIPQVLDQLVKQDMDSERIHHIIKKHNLKPWDLFLEGSSILTYENRIDPIYIIDRDYNIQTLEQVSPLMAKLANEISMKKSVFISEKARSIGIEFQQK